MITRFLTSVTTAFCPFNARAGKTARSFLAMLPPNARRNMAVNVKMLPRTEVGAAGTLKLQFKDGKEMAVDLENMKIKDIMAEVNRHSRILAREEELKG